MAKITKSADTRKTGEIVVSAIKKLMKNTGWTSRTIIKFIKMEYGITENSISGKVSRALKRGVRLGLLQLERGRYRLNEMSTLARHVTTHEVRKQLRLLSKSKQAKHKRRHEIPIRMNSPVLR